MQGYLCQESNTPFSTTQVYIREYHLKVQFAKSASWSYRWWVLVLATEPEGDKSLRLSPQMVIWTEDRIHAGSHLTDGLLWYQAGNAAWSDHKHYSPLVYVSFPSQWFHMVEIFPFSWWELQKHLLPMFLSAFNIQIPWLTGSKCCWEIRGT